MSTLSEFAGIDINGIAQAAVQYQMAKNASRASADSNTLEQLKGTIPIYAETNRALVDALKLRNKQTTSGILDNANLPKYALIASVLVGAYFLLK